MINGIYDNLDINEYHADNSISSTGINLILDCPKRYYYEYHVKRTELDTYNNQESNLEVICFNCKSQK